MSARGRPNLRRWGRGREGLLESRVRRTGKGLRRGMGSGVARNFFSGGANP